MADSIQGDGLVRVQRALLGLQGDPLRLDRERQRFSHSPPTYTSNPSGAPTRSPSLVSPGEHNHRTRRTRSPSPVSPSEEDCQERRFKLGMEHSASEPDRQFIHQVRDEKWRIIHGNLNRTYPLRGGIDDPDKIARKNVTKRWVEQGIWNSKWNQSASGRWKHEEPLESESESESELELVTEPEAGPPSPIFSFFPKKPQPIARQSKTVDEMRQVAERRFIQKRERELSRPYHQFVYQISTERERIKEESTNREGIVTADINTRAYENVKNTWIKRSIWNKRWGVLPGMSWKHEHPFEELVHEELGDDPVVAKPVVDGDLQAATRPIFGPSFPVLAKPVVNGDPEAAARPILGPPFSIQSNNQQVSLNISQQGPLADIPSARSENGDAERSPSARDSPSLHLGQSILGTKMGQALLTKVSREDGQLTNAFLGSVHPSKIAKAAGIKKGPQQQLKPSQKLASDSLQLFSSVNIAESQPSQLPLDYVAPRRSQRIQLPVPIVSKDPIRAASTNPSKRVVRPKTERNASNNLTARSSAKPQGISKKQPAKITRKGGKGKMKN
ncbi:hypothetical protein SBOR_5139 [Sclerotinia borealis F-4128]|uniref:Uncharacterized protein n=1 Tax=Sclerotinia borealis (strain F-4128) TaxID=1432307 RepID=W9CF50_SCLBF|nr:hypothetical protein SBOR_5139 [Sclerotinia borealis F-4128]